MKERIPNKPVGREQERRAQLRQEKQRKKAHIAVPGWKLLRVTDNLCDSPKPSPRPSINAIKRISAATLQNIALRLRPMNGAHQCGSHLSENVRLTDPTSLSGVSSFVNGSTEGFVVLKMLILLKIDFLGAEEGVSHGTWVIAGFCSVAIINNEVKEGIQSGGSKHCRWIKE
jgi:hypothetical protein